MIAWPFQQVSMWAATHVFHITGVGATFHPTGSGDGAVQWVQQLVFLTFALTGASVWTLVAWIRKSQRTQYQTLYAWLRFLLRLTCAMFMFRYGFDKVFPLQMPPVSIAVLNEPVGNMSPVTFLWSLIGLNPWYEVVCGTAEVCGGVLLLFRRTALAGALISAFVMTNVLLFNLFFDVPVKIFAATLLLALLFICLPDAKALWMFFWKHQPAAPAGVWVPPAERKAFRIATRTVEIVYVVAIVFNTSVPIGYRWMQNRKETAVSTPLVGAWHVDGTTPESAALRDPENGPISDIYIDSNIRAFSRGTGGELWRTRLHQDTTKHAISINIYSYDNRHFSYAMPDQNHLILTEVPSKEKGKAKPASNPLPPAKVLLTRIPVPTHYPLLDRGFHLVNEWGFER
jgi:hypothetical protein